RCRDARRRRRGCEDAARPGDAHTRPRRRERGHARALAADRSAGRARRWARSGIRCAAMATVTTRIRRRVDVERLPILLLAGVLIVAAVVNMHAGRDTTFLFADWNSV